MPWWREWQPTPVFLPGESHGHRRLAGYSPPGHKESDMTERLTHLWLNRQVPSEWTVHFYRGQTQAARWFKVGNSHFVLPLIPWGTLKIPALRLHPWDRNGTPRKKDQASVHSMCTWCSVWKSTVQSSAVPPQKLPATCGHARWSYLK